MKHKIIISSYDDIHNPYYGGGGAATIHRVANNLKNKFNVTVITAKYPGSYDGKVDGVNYKRIGFGIVGPRIGQLIFQALLPFYALILKYDLWMESFTPPFSTAFLPIFTKKPVVGLVHMLASEDMERKYKMPFHIVENFGLKRYKNLIVTSNYFKEKIAKVNPHSNICIIPIGVEHQTIEKNVNRKKYILFLGRIEVDQKGIDLLLRAYKLIENKISYKLVIAGNGTKKEEDLLKVKIKELNLEKRVSLLGRVSGIERDKIFTNATMFAMSSRFETFGLVALEAMSYGIPVVSFDIEGLRWARDSSMQVSKFNYRRFAKAILTLSKEKNTRKYLIEKGIYMADKHSWDNIIQRYSSFVNEILDKDSSMKKDLVLNHIIEKQVHCYFISPHLDDAAFSAGSLLHYLSQHTKVTVINVFTSAGIAPYTLSAKSFLRQNKYDSIDKLLQDRRDEDRLTFKNYNIEIINLGYQDALWRKKPRISYLTKKLSKILPELIHVYPTYRWHIARGNVSRNDFFLYEKLQGKLKKIIRSENIVFCPIGYGNHVDHIITREACRTVFENLIYWSDFPYCLKSGTQKKFLRRDHMSKFTFKSPAPIKRELILGYQTQVPTIFGSKEVPIISENYYSHQFLFKDK